MSEDVEVVASGSLADFEAEVEREVERRLEQRQLSTVVEGLRKDFTLIRREISNSNHLKRDFGQQLRDLVAQVSELNARVATHMATPMHAGTAERFAELERNFNAAEEEFGLDNLSAEERAAFPVVVRTVLAGQKRASEQRQADKEHAEEDARMWQSRADRAVVDGHRLTYIALAVAAVSALSGMASQFGLGAWVRTAIFHLSH